MKPAPTPQQFWIGMALVFMMGVVFLGTAVAMYWEGQLRYSNGRWTPSRIITETSGPALFWGIMFVFAAVGVLFVFGVLATILKHRASQRQELDRV